MSNPENPHGGNLMRKKGSSLAGKASMAIGRSLDPILQYSLLRNGYAAAILENVFRAKRIIALPLVNRVAWPGVGLGFLGGPGLGAAAGYRDFWGPSMVDKPGNLLVTMSGIFALRHVSPRCVYFSGFDPLLTNHRCADLLGVVHL